MTRFRVSAAHGIESIDYHVPPCGDATHHPTCTCHLGEGYLHLRDPREFMPTTEHINSATADPVAAIAAMGFGAIEAFDEMTHLHATLAELRARAAFLRRLNVL